jgi:hypothetical protein
MMNRLVQLTARTPTTSLSSVPSYMVTTSHSSFVYASLSSYHGISSLFSSFSNNNARWSSSAATVTATGSLASSDASTSTTNSSGHHHGEATTATGGRFMMIDLASMLYRAHFGYGKNPRYRMNTNGDVQHVSALLGYGMSISQMLAKSKPSHVAVCADGKRADGWRRKEFEGYKAHRGSFMALVSLF